MSFRMLLFFLLLFLNDILFQPLIPERWFWWQNMLLVMTLAVFTYFVTGSLGLLHKRMPFKLGVGFIVILLTGTFILRLTEDEAASNSIIGVIQTTIKDRSLKDYLTSEHDYFTFRYKGNINEELMISYINETKSNCESFLALSSLPSLSVIFYEKSEFEKASILKDVTAFYDDRDKSINVMADFGNGEVQSLLRSMSHEYVHYYFNAVLAENNIDNTDIPVWFHEGVAEYISHVDQNYAEVSYKFLAFQDQDTSEEWAAARKSVGNPYHQAYIAVQELIKIRGNQAIQLMIDQVRGDIDFYSALEQTANMNLSSFEKIVNENMYTD